MPTFTTQAVVLAKRPLREADRLYILYSSDYGKIEAQVKSAVLCTSKMAGSLEPISQVEVMMVRGKARETIAGVQLLKRYQLNDLSTFIQVSLVRELFLKLIKEGVREKDLYQSLLFYLEAQAGNEGVLWKRFLTQRFIWQMIDILGVRPKFEGKNQMALSGEAKKLLRAEPKDKPPSFSGNLLQELESSTKRYLHDFLESDLSSFNLFNYA